MNGFLLFVHLSAVTAWVGGMFFATVCLHPSLAVLQGNLFFSEELQDIAAAKRICALCPAIAPCLEGALDRCRAAGVRLIDETPRLGAEGKRIAFLHPSATAGVLVELSEY